MNDSATIATTGKVVEVDHPLVKHKLTLLRRVECDTAQFRLLVEELANLLTYEATKDLETEDVEIDTPITRMTGSSVSGKKVAVVPILRAGLGMVDGVLRMVPVARIGHIGLYRDEETLEPVTYYEKLPDDMAQRDVLVLDPMLATGGSVTVAVDALKRAGAQRIKMLAILAAPEGIARLQADHPDVDIYVAGIDERLNEKGYIVPGLGDAGDRLFGTK
ncbi:MAG: uracil phosphoribosyltransferase [Thermoleophilia bacterium]|nr:uracil phosphoribosyltransferase [Thermoleophilia bacterium]